MNFYTLTFRKKIIISFLLILGNLIILDFGLYFATKWPSTKTSFINDKFSKVRHFKLNNSKSKDIIFIGSSRTFYHISTNTFMKNHINIYNFGVSGAQFEDYPTLTSDIKISNPKKIVISLSINRLYDKLNVSNFPTLAEITYYYDINKIIFFKSLRQWIINRHLFLQYSEPIFYKIQSSYNRFNYIKKESQVLQHTDSKMQNNKEILIDNSINYSKLVGCKVFNMKQINNRKIALKCMNGDGILLGNNIKKDFDREELKELDQESIKYLQKLINDINTINTKVTIIFEPVFNNTYSYELNEIKKRFKGTEIIDLTSLKIKDSFWADNEHLNNEGREAYSSYLSKVFNNAE